MSYKYIVLLGDGMADWPIVTYGNKTPLEIANTPNMDTIASLGRCGLVETVPEGIKPGSDVANLGVLGYDVRSCYTGRGPIEAASLGINITEDELAFRCNLVNIEDGIMKDFTAGHINNDEAEKIIKYLQENTSSDEIKFYKGVSYRNIAVLDKRFSNLKTTPPHDITDKYIHNYLPAGKYEEHIRGIMELVRKLLLDYRQKNNLASPTDIWLWSQGHMPQLRSFWDKFHLKGGIVTAVDLLKGIAKLTGMLAPNVEGATGFLDTNYENKMQSAFQILNENDFVYIHIEAPDEAGHMGRPDLKIQAIEDFDKYVVGPALEYAKNQSEKVKILLMPDHPTPCKIKTHAREAVPFCIFDDNQQGDMVDKYSERSVVKGSFGKIQVLELMPLFLS